MAKMTVARIKLLRSKREVVVRRMRRDIAMLLETSQDATARIRIVLKQIKQDNSKSSNPKPHSDALLKQSAEVLSVDAFSAFEDVGLDNEKAVQETGQRFRETILALGGGKAPLEVEILCTWLLDIDFWTLHPLTYTKDAN